MAAKQRRINLGRISRDDVLLALGAPFSILDVIADLQLNGVGPEATASALHEDWLVVGVSMQGAMDEYCRVSRSVDCM